MLPKFWPLGPTFWQGGKAKATMRPQRLFTNIFRTQHVCRIALGYSITALKRRFLFSMSLAFWIVAAVVDLASSEEVAVVEPVEQPLPGDGR